MRDKNRLRVYIAGPFRQGAQLRNVREAVLVGLALRSSGYVPVIPYFYCLAHYLQPMPDEFWLAWGLDELRACDCLLRLPGDSVGSDVEVAQAKVLGMPVYFGLDALLAQVPSCRTAQD